MKGKRFNKNEVWLNEQGFGMIVYRSNHATVCLIVDRRVTGASACLARGVAFCNPVDTYDRRVGRDRALGMAVQAFQKLPVKHGASLMLIRDAVKRRAGFDSAERARILTHGDFAPVLTLREMKLVVEFVRKSARV